MVLDLENIKYCNSCKKEITNETGAVEFPCPQCGKSIIIRCEHCREVVATYSCPSCGFEGP